MNKKMIIKNGLFLFLTISIIPGCVSNIEKPIQNFVNQGAVLASGVNFDTGKLVVVDSESGREVPPCIQKNTTTTTNYQLNEKKDNTETLGNQECKTEFILSDNAALRTALELSKSPIKGQIKKDGQIQSATYIVIVKALYTGSHCNTDGSGGSQYEKCGRR